MVTGIELVGPVASPAFKAVIEAAKSRLQKVADDKTTDAIAALTYLETADEMMTTLEAEADQLIITAIHLPHASDMAAERAALHRRLNDLLYGEVIRPVLAKLYARLQVCSEVLEQDSKRFFGKLAPKDNKQLVLDALNRTLDDIASYLKKLETESPGYYASAPYITELMDLQKALAKGEDPQTISDRAHSVLLSRVPMALGRSAQIGDLCERIRTQLR
jgi:hypothetical protein